MPGLLATAVLWRLPRDLGFSGEGAFICFSSERGPFLLGLGGGIVLQKPSVPERQGPAHERPDASTTLLSSVTH